MRRLLKEFPAQQSLTWFLRATAAGRRIQAAKEALADRFHRKKSNQWELFEHLYRAWEGDPERVVDYDTLLSDLGYDPRWTMPKPLYEAKSRLQATLDDFSHRGVHFSINNEPSGGYRLVVFKGRRLVWKGRRLHSYDRRAWEAGHLAPGPPVFGRLRLATALCAGAALLWLIPLVLASVPEPQPATVELRQGSLVWQDADGREILRRDIASALSSPPNPHPVRFKLGVGPRSHVLADLEGDGSIESLVAIQEISGATRRVFLCCFEQDGSLRWKARLGRTLSIGRDSLGASDFTWVWIEAVDLERDGRREVLVRVEHRLRAPSQILILGPWGSRRLEYWHEGHIYLMFPAPESWPVEPSLLLAGVHQPSSRAFAALLPVDGGRMILEDARFDVPGHSRGGEHAYVLIPRSLLARARDARPQPSRIDFTPEGTIDIQVDDAGLLPGIEAPVFVTLGSDLEPMGALVGDGLAQAHRMAWAMGALEGRTGPEGWAALRASLERFEVRRRGETSWVRVPVSVPQGPISGR